MTDPKLYQLEKILHKTFGENIPSYRLLNNVRIPHQLGETSPSSYHFLMYDEATEMGIGSALAPVDPRFSLHMSNARNLFKENPEMSQIILRYRIERISREIVLEILSQHCSRLFQESATMLR
jgi:hypothetical protein